MGKIDSKKSGKVIVRTRRETSKKNKQKVGVNKRIWKIARTTREKSKRKDKRQGLRKKIRQKPGSISKESNRSHVSKMNKEKDIHK